MGLSKHVDSADVVQSPDSTMKKGAASPGCGSARHVSGARKHTVPIRCRCLPLPCFERSTCRSYWLRRHRSGVRKLQCRMLCTMLCTTQSPMACVRWEGHGIGWLYARGGCSCPGYGTMVRRTEDHAVIGWVPGRGGGNIGGGEGRGGGGRGGGGDGGGGGLGGGGDELGGGAEAGGGDDCGVTAA